MASRWVMNWFWSCNVIALFLLFLWPPPSSSSEAVETVDVHAAKHLVCSGHRYLDVRTVDEFNKGHVENATNVPYLFFNPQGREKNPKFVEQVSLVCSKDDRMVVGCESGKRSLQATVDLVNAGFKHAKNVGGGYAAWVENGFAVKKPQEEPLRYV